MSFELGPSPSTYYSPCQLLMPLMSALCHTILFSGVRNVTFIPDFC